MLELPQLVLAQAAADDGGGGAVGLLVPMVAMFAIVYFMMIRPQQKTQREHGDFLSTLQKGQEVVTSGGVVGKVHQVNADTVTLEIAKDVRIQVVKSYVYAWKPPVASAAAPAAGKDGEQKPVESKK
jgi:preprotein translocase subunit YajC